MFSASAKARIGAEVESLRQKLAAAEAVRDRSRADEA
jgi:hypothetical protein